MATTINSPLASHPLHFNLGDHFRRMSEENSVILCDCACGGVRKLSLFSDDKRSFATKIGEVDAALCIRLDGNLHCIGIIEIEECGGQGGGFIPDRLFGKFMKASAGVWLSGPKGERITMLPGFFLQIINVSDLSERSSKLNQYENISSLIDNRFLPMHWIREYHYLTGTFEDFTSEDYAHTLQEFINSMKHNFSGVVTQGA